MTNPILERAVAAIKEKDLTQAQALLAEALIEDSNDVEAWMLLADILPADQARESLERVLQIEPGHAEARNRLGLAPLETTEVEAASEEPAAAEQPAKEEIAANLSFEPQIETEATAEIGLDLEEQLSKDIPVESEEAAAPLGTEAEPDVDFMNLFKGEEEIAAEISSSELEMEAAEPPAEEPAADHEITEEEIEALLAGMGAEDTAPAAEPDFDTILASLAPEGEEVAEDSPVAKAVTEPDAEVEIEPEEAQEAALPEVDAEAEGGDEGDFFRNLFDATGEEAEAAAEGKAEALPEAETDALQPQAFTLEEEDETPADMFAIEIEPDEPGSSFSLEEDESGPESEGETHPPEKKRRRSHRRSLKGMWISLGVVTVLLAAILGGLSWYYFYGPCGVQLVIDSDYAITDITSRWDESMMIATRSSRIVLAEPLRRMFDIRRELDKTEVPGCLLPAKSSLQKSMYYTLDAYDKLFKYENEFEITKRFTLASQQRRLFETQIDAVRYCAPLSCP